MKKRSPVIPALAGAAVGGLLAYLLASDDVRKTVKDRLNVKGKL